MAFLNVSSSSVVDCTKPNFARVKMLARAKMFAGVKLLARAKMFAGAKLLDRVKMLVRAKMLARARYRQGNFCISNMRSLSQEVAILEEN